MSKMSAFGKKSYRKLAKYMDEGQSATFISKNTLAPRAWYHIHGGKGEYRLVEPLLVICRPKKYNFRCDPDTHEITVRIKIQSTISMGEAAAQVTSKEDQAKIQAIRTALLDTVLVDRLGLTLGGDTSLQGLVILVRAGAYSIVEADRAYWISLNLEDNQNPLGARLVRGGPYVPKSTGSSSMETASSSARSIGLHGAPGLSAVATYGSTDGDSSAHSATKAAVPTKQKKWNKKSPQQQLQPNVPLVQYLTPYQELHERHPGFFESETSGPGRAADEELDVDFRRMTLGTSGARTARCEQQ